ncbi:MAG TPA: LysR family transcriptional regulator [Nevskiaceae bacterium]|nr:LysR family transcriptional regulator [Nevskiaceae bacterium]
MLERKHLAIVREVERQGSLTAAAETLFVTQSALSHTIAKLEARLGTAIWLRDGRHLQLTPAGRALLAVADRVLPQLEQAEARLQQFARGERGALHIGMECYPCYRWLLKIVSPYLHAWPAVDVDVKQKFQFGALGALLDHEIDLLITPDPVFKPRLKYEAVFDYEQVLVVARTHRLATAKVLRPIDLQEEVLVTYPVSIDRLDIYSHFLNPAGILPKRHKIFETTDILLQMVASGRGVTALPRWLVQEYAQQLDIVPVRIGPHGIQKHIYLGAREEDLAIDYLRAFIALARQLPGAAARPAGKGLD